EAKSSLPSGLFRLGLTGEARTEGRCGHVPIHLRDSAMDTSRRHFLRLGGLATMAGSAGIVRSPLLDAELLAASPAARSRRVPGPLPSGDVLGSTSPSAGVEPALRARMRSTYRTRDRRGYAYREGECLWGRSLLSAPARQRAEELTRMLLD